VTEQDQQGQARERVGEKDDAAVPVFRISRETGDEIAETASSRWKIVRTKRKQIERREYNAAR
jgi:hypothetical protein